MDHTVTGQSPKSVTQTKDTDHLPDEPLVKTAKAVRMAMRFMIGVRVREVFIQIMRINEGWQ